jgi:hypothetical protein
MDGMTDIHDYEPDDRGVCVARIPNPDAPMHSITCGAPRNWPYHPLVPKPEFAVGDRVDSVYGDGEHVGTVVETDTFADGVPYWIIERDSDEFRWVGWAGTMRRVDE